MPDPISLDKRRIRRNFARAAPDYETAAALSPEVCARMLERLDLVRLAPGADPGCRQRYWCDDAGGGPSLPSGSGLRTRLLSACAAYAAPRRILVDGRNASHSGAPPSAAVCADFERLPLRSGVMDLAVSNLALHWSNAPDVALTELQRVLRGGGLLMFTTFGPDTLKELAQASARCSWALTRAFLRRHARSGRHADSQWILGPGYGHGAPHAHLHSGRGLVSRPPDERGNVNAS